MVNSFCKVPLSECNGKLVQVALGNEPADLVIRNVRLVSVTTHEVLEGSDIAVSCGRIAYVGTGGHTAEHCIGPDTKVVDGCGKYATPGFLDGHIHIESAMVGVSEFARATIPHGTVGVYADPHEIANVCGLEGVWAMFEGARNTPLKAMITTPSCVPAVEGFEDTGAAINAADVAATMQRDDVVGLGEMMNYPGILAGDKNATAEVAATLAAGRSVTGHFPDQDCDRKLNAYIASGVTSCHESTTPEQILARVRLGMYAQLREGSAWQDLQQLSHALTDSVVSSRYVNLVSDDLHPNTITDEGHLDRILRMAVGLGIDPLEAIEMVTINTATNFQMQAELGSLTPGKCADIVLLEDLVDFEVQRVFIDGEEVASYGVPTFDCPPFEWPDWMTHTMRLGMDVTPQTFDVPAPEGCGDTVRVRAIRMSAGSTIAEAVEVDLPVVDGLVQADVDNDVLKVFVFDRHHDKPSFGVGFVQGFKIRGTVAQTVAHDAHNLIVVGRSNEDMAQAANELIACGGGEVAVHEGRVLAKVELPVGGIMSDADVDTVANKVECMQRAWRTMGCRMPSPFMTMALISLACIPERRLTNRGYVDCVNYQFEDLFV